MSDLEALRALMEADRWIDRVEAQKSHRPESLELAGVESELRALAQQLRASDENLAPVRRSGLEAAGESQRLRSRAQALRERLDASTANVRELTALQHELDVVLEHLSSAEDHEFALMEQLEPLEEARAAIMGVAQPLAAHRESLRATIQELTASLDEELVALREQRGERVHLVPSPLRERYEAALRRAGVSGAAEVSDGRCEGCRIALAPLDYERWRHQGAGLDFACPECGRLLLP